MAVHISWWEELIGVRVGCGACGTEDTRVFVGNDVVLQLQAIRPKLERHRLENPGHLPAIGVVSLGHIVPSSESAAWTDDIEEMGRWALPFTA